MNEAFYLNTYRARERVGREEMCEEGRENVGNIYIEREREGGGGGGKKGRKNRI
jgi:hypothetical protein